MGQASLGIRMVQLPGALQLPKVNDILQTTDVVLPTWDPDVNIGNKRYFSLHHVLAVQKSQISLPVGSTAAQSGKLGLKEM